MRETLNPYPFQSFELQQPANGICMAAPALSQRKNGEKPLNLRRPPVGLAREVALGQTLTAPLLHRNPVAGTLLLNVPAIQC